MDNLMESNTMPLETTFSIPESKVENLTMSEIAKKIELQCFPLCNGSHWYLCLYSSTKRSLTVFDSMGSINNGVNQLRNAVEVHQGTSAINVSVGRCPIQPDCDMCGICVARNIDTLIFLASDPSNALVDTCLYEVSMEADSKYRLSMLYWILAALPC
jgi:hypothetical protein